MSTGDVVFIPRVTDGNLSKSNLGIDSAIMNASTAAGTPGVLQNIQKAVKLLLIDPETDRLTLEQSSFYKKLPYASVDATKLYSDAEYRLRDFVIPVLDFQRERGLTVLSTPYLAYEHFNTEYFNVNLAMVNETIGNIKANGDDVKVNVMVGPKCNALLNLQEVSYIAARYGDDFKDDVDFFTVKVEGLNDKEASIDELLGLARLVHELSWRAPVVVNPVGGFGLVLALAGASYLSRSWRGNEAYVAKKTPRGKNPPAVRVYYPPAMNNLDINDLKALKYSCDCDSCGGKLPETNEAIVNHKVTIVRDQYRELSALEGDARVEYVKNQYKAAQNELNALAVKKLGPKNSSYINKWSTVLGEVLKWSQEPEEDVELDKLLEEIDKDD